MYSLYLQYIISYTVNNNSKSAIFSPKVSMITSVILILCNSSINNKLILRDLHFRHHISCFCSISPTKIIPNTVTVLFCVSEQHDSDSFLNESTV